MKIGVISDIHGNVYALEAVLEYLEKQCVERLVNLGDTFYGPIAPKATFDLMQQHDIVTIRGNQDRIIFEAKDDNVAENLTLQMVVEELQGEPFSWLTSLPGEFQLDENIYLCHGAPGNDMTYLLEDVTSGRPEVRSEAEIVRRLGGQNSPLVLCGHTHIPRTIALASGQLIVNPGSVGLPAYCDDEPIPHTMENYTPQASCAVIEQTSHGWIVQHCNVPYNVQAAVDKCHRLNRSDWAYFLETGRADKTV